MKRGQWNEKKVVKRKESEIKWGSGKKKKGKKKEKKRKKKEKKKKTERVRVEGGERKGRKKKVKVVKKGRKQKVVESSCVGEVVCWKGFSGGLKGGSFVEKGKKGCLKSKGRRVKKGKSLKGLAQVERSES